jgi:methionyl aminopeptidase
MIIQNKEEYQNLKISGQILASCIFHLTKMIKAGINAKQLDDFAYQFITSYDATPSFLGYDGFKYSICTSVDNEIAHGLSNEQKIIKENSVVNLDVGVNYKSMITDSGYTIAVGDVVKHEIENLLKGTKEALQKGVSRVKSGARLGDIGEIIDQTAKKYKLGNVYELGGHGVGKSVHEEPFIANFGTSGKGQRLFENQVIAIEPLFTTGKGDAIFDETSEDGWTVRTADNSTCAQFEHTVIVTKKGFEILTDFENMEILPIK